MNYTLKQFPNKVFTDKMDLTRFMKKNIVELRSIKMSEYKTKSEPVLKDSLFQKEFTPLIEDISGDFIQVKTVINTTNVIDSHMDLHMQGIWNKAVADNPFTHHLKQHQQSFESVISRKAKSFNEKMNFKDLGLSIDKEMDANINEFTLERKKHPFMFDSYKDGDVREHSVGMFYVALDLAYYDEDSEKEMNFFNESLKHAINPEIAEQNGYVWVVSEAGKREGSAVVFGSNSITPTLSVKNYEPPKSTRSNKNEPPKSTQNKSKEFYTNLI